VAIGLVIDRMVGEPPEPLHPVARFGASMQRLEHAVWADTRAAGLGYVAVGVGSAMVVGLLADELLGEAVGLAVAVSVSSAALALTRAAETVAGHLGSGDLGGARRALVSLVGRDPSQLDENEIARAVVESLAENLSDAVVATALWGLLAGTPGALAHRAANTLDAMVGHRNARHQRFGWASARLDDLLGWPAARATALLVAIAVPSRTSEIWRACRIDAPAHPSPNAGVAEAAFAAALELQLGGTNRYGEREEIRPALGSGVRPVATDIDRAVALVRRTSAILELVLAGVWLMARLTGPDRAHAGRRTVRRRRP
jgi:adenosylcobinamide-phosphate synthase